MLLVDAPWYVLAQAGSARDAAAYLATSLALTLPLALRRTAPVTAAALVLAGRCSVGLRARHRHSGAWVAEASGCVDLTAWPSGTRLFLRKERPHPGAQLRITDAQGMRITGFLTNTGHGRPGHQLADLELRHRRHARGARAHTRRRVLHIDSTWPRAEAITTTHTVSARSPALTRPPHTANRGPGAPADHAEPATTHVHPAAVQTEDRQRQRKITVRPNRGLTAMTAVRVTGTTGIGALVSPFLSALGRHLDGIGPVAAGHLADAVLGMLAAALHPAEDLPLCQSRPEALLLQVQDYIDDHLPEPDLGPDSIAGATTSRPVTCKGSSSSTARQ